MARLPVLNDSSAPDAGGRPTAGGAGAVLSEGQRLEIARELTQHLSGEVRFGRHDRLLYATDASLYQVEPIGVAIPDSIEDAVRAVAFCGERRLPILPRGGGTSLAGQAVNRAIVIDLSSGCREIRAVFGEDEKGRPTRCLVDAGVTVEDLNDRLRERGVFFPPDPATARHATIGGCVGNNAAGTRSVRYGRTSENLLGIDACLWDGARVRFDRGAARRDQRVRAITEEVVAIVRQHADLIRERFPKTIRRNAGYALDLVLQQIEEADREGLDPLDTVNLAHLLCGAEGTLAVTLSAEVTLSPLPASRALAIVGFSSVDEAVGAVPAILETGPSAIELLDDMVLSLARENNEYRRYAGLMPKDAAGEPPEAVLYVEYFFDEADDGPEARFARLAVAVGEREIARYTDAASMGQALKLRKAGEPLLHGVPGDRKPLTFVEDNAVPVERLGEFVRRFREIVRQEGTEAAYYAHASVGVLHVRPLLSLEDPDDHPRMERIATEVADLARELGGVMSGEHGDGRVRGPLLERYFGPELMDAFRAVKKVFDPHGLLNPGNVVSPGPIASIHQSTRVAPLNRTLPKASVDTFFDFSDQHGLHGAAAMCNGAGVCRKKSGGVMCPSYMATLDERHSTRGRGNALRLAISGQAGDEGTLGSPAWNDPETIETLDLCLSCKACKSECPSNVDIARLKAEYTAQRHAEHGTPLVFRIFASIRVLNRLGAATPELANWVNALPPVRALINRVLGLHPDRSLPRFESSLANRWRQTASRGPAVVLFGDCFTMYNEPGIGLAARRVLEAFGYRVVLADAGCCGRAQISMGLLPEARRTIERNAPALAKIIEREHARAVIVLEPSCLSAIRDDWGQLKTSVHPESLRDLADRCTTLESFIESPPEPHPREAKFRTDARDIVLHGHCHQKALWGTAETVGMLSRVGEVREVDTTCCGMAGSFGYTKDRYGLSMKIGELSLLPAVRDAAQNDAVVVAPGTSCRHQIHDGAQHRALHPAEYLADRLESS